MNWPALGLLGVVALLMMPGSKKLEAGKVYAATFQPPQGLLVSEDTLGKIRSIMPPNSLVAVGDGGTIIVTFTSVSNKEMSDFDTPFGTFKLLSVKPV